jgi:hypothetical protein
MHHHLVRLNLQPPFLHVRILWVGGVVTFSSRTSLLVLNMAWEPNKMTHTHTHKTHTHTNDLCCWLQDAGYLRVHFGCQDGHLLPQLLISLQQRKRGKQLETAGDSYASFVGWCCGIGLVHLYLPAGNIDSQIDWAHHTHIHYTHLHLQHRTHTQSEIHMAHTHTHIKPHITCWTDELLPLLVSKRMRIAFRSADVWARSLIMVATCCAWRLYARPTFACDKHARVWGLTINHRRKA